MLNYSDLEDAYQLVLIIADCSDEEEDSFLKKIRSNWEKSINLAKEEIIDLSIAEKIKKANHGRRVPDKYLNNTVIVGKTKGGNLIALDGNHRLIQHMENQNNNISVLFVDISWLDDADDMDYDYDFGFNK